MRDGGTAQLIREENENNCCWRMKVDRQQVVEKSKKQNKTKKLKGLDVA